MRGRKPVPKPLRQLRGNPGHRPLPIAAELPSGTLTCPRDLDATGRAEWRRLVKTLGPLATPASAGMIYLAADAYAALRRAQAILNKEGEVYETTNAQGARFLRQHPAVLMRDRARAQYLRALTELGASPVSACRVSVPPSAPAERTTITKLLD